MNDFEFTKEEKELLRQYQKISPKILSLLNRLSVEVIPPIIFIVIWFYTGRVIYLIALIAILVIFNVQRVLRQYKNILLLNSISKKTIGEITKAQ
ncbi:hypothetical protein [Methyloglobulus sp.]|uniref:hypothetical protein n=1 Tax=Methyloglobulus sp. TaxID=2518622 RepID=UPI0032B83F28